MRIVMGLSPTEDDQPLTIYPPDRKKLREHLERSERLEQEVRELREKNRRLQEELRRYKACAPMLAAFDHTAEATNIPSSRVSYRRPTRSDPRPTGAQVGPPGQRRERPVPYAPPCCSPSSSAPTAALGLALPSRFIGGRSSNSLPPNRGAPVRDPHDNRHRRTQVDSDLWSADSPSDGLSSKCRRRDRSLQRSGELIHRQHPWGVLIGVDSGIVPPRGNRENDARTRTSVCDRSGDRVDPIHERRGIPQYWRIAMSTIATGEANRNGRRTAIA